MKVTVLGGAGDIGRIAAHVAATYDFVEHIVVADLDLAAARTVADQIDATAVRVDVTDSPALVALLRQGDVVLNTVGPYFRFGVPVLKAAIDAGVHYLDICDDWEPTLEMLALNDAAVDSGVTAVVGLGASPGVSNLLAMAAMQRLDNVDTVITGWGLDDDDVAGTSTTGRPDDPPPAAGAAMVHWVQQFSGTIRVWDHGRYCDVPALRPHELEYPGRGRTEVWTVGHPEALTIPLTRPELRTCLNVMAISPEGAAVLHAIAHEVSTGRVTVESAAAGLPGRIEASIGAAGALDSPLPKLFAHASGTVDGAVARCAATIAGRPANGMGGATSVPLAIGLDLLHHGLLRGPGVRTPEDAVPADAFFDRYARHCDPPFEHRDQLLDISLSLDAPPDSELAQR